MATDYEYENTVDKHNLMQYRRFLESCFIYSIFNSYYSDSTSYSLRLLITHMNLVWHFTIFILVFGQIDPLLKL